MGISPEQLVSRVQVNIPFPFVVEKYLFLFLQRGLNPEIGLDAWSLSHYPPRCFRRIAWAFQQRGLRLTLHAPFQDLAPGALDDAVLAASRRRLRQAFRWLAVFRPAAIVCHLGYEARYYRGDLENWLARSTATWKELAGLAAPYGVLVTLENVYETEKELFAEIISRVQAPNLKVCLDVGHLLAFGDGDFDGWLETLWPHIGHLHLHDNQGDADDHLALGTGKVPIAHVLSFLADKGLRPLVTLEPHQEDSLTPSLNYLAEIWPWEE
jgi:sugar phosphate isomerase/epimerase|uniref:Sugar phosphate isomerase/epimerase n=1 Tax=Desulfobacca acetoxidans TaxID=60893 RepID=A0A7C3SM60_9BACT